MFQFTFHAEEKPSKSLKEQEHLNCRKQNRNTNRKWDFNMLEKKENKEGFELSSTAVGAK